MLPPSDGSCPDASYVNNCAAFCQQTTAWHYGTEVPFENSECSADDSSCSITDTKTTTVTNTYTFSAQVAKRDQNALAEREDSPTVAILQAAFNLGSTYSYSISKANAVATSNTKPSNADGQCGYWTFIPYYVTVCGALTAGLVVTNTGVNHAIVQSCVDLKNTTNFCQSTPYLNPDGSADGETVFVATACAGHYVLEFCYQQDVYCLPGVSTNASIYKDSIYAHENWNVDAPYESTAIVQCKKGNWPPPAKKRNLAEKMVAVLFGRSE